MHSQTEAAWQPVEFDPGPRDEGSGAGARPKPPDDFLNARIVPGREPVEHVVVSARVLDSGLRFGLDNAVFLHATFLMEQWRRWHARAAVLADPEPEVSEQALLRALAARNVAHDDGQPLALTDVPESLHRVAAAGIVRGLSLRGGGQ